MRCAGLHAELTKLPPRIPATLAEAMSFEPPDHDLENRSASGSSTGAMHGVRFGTGSGRETKHAHLADYYKLSTAGCKSSSVNPTLLSSSGAWRKTSIFFALSATTRISPREASWVARMSRSCSKPICCDKPIRYCAPRSSSARRPLSQRQRTNYVISVLNRSQQYFARSS